MDSFENFIRKLLQRNINDLIIDKILKENMHIFRSVFTTKKVDKDYNYEFFEQLGDLTINKFIVTYIGKKFPHLRSSEGVDVIAKARILYGSKDELSKIANKLGFNKYIICTKLESLDNNKITSILEDVFEAFFGATEYIIDRIYFNGMGYITVYNILESIYNELDIRIDYETLVDSKSKLNELKDFHKLDIKYIDTKNPDETFTSKILLTHDNYINKIIAKGTSIIKKNAQTQAAEEALKWIEENLKIVKYVPLKYKDISDHFW